MVCNAASSRSSSRISSNSSRRWCVEAVDTLGIFWVSVCSFFTAGWTLLPFPFCAAAMRSSLNAALLRLRLAF